MTGDRMPGTWLQEDRDQMDAAAKQMAEVLYRVRTWRGSLRVEHEGCVYKIEVKGYAKKGSARWIEEEHERAKALAEFEREYGPLEEHNP